MKKVDHSKKGGDATSGRINLMSILLPPILLSILSVLQKIVCSTYKYFTQTLCYIPTPSQSM